MYKTDSTITENEMPIFSVLCMAIACILKTPTTEILETWNILLETTDVTKIQKLIYCWNCKIDCTWVESPFLFLEIMNKFLLS